MDTARWLASAAVVAAILATHVGSASAAAPGLEVVTTATGSDSASPKSVVVTCPAGKRVVGTGMYIDGSDGAQSHVVLSEIVPASTTVRVTAHEGQGGTAATWWLRAFAVCVEPLPGLEIRTATSVSSSSAKSVTATCPSGKRALAGGAAVTGAAGHVVITSFMPTGGSAVAGAHEDFDGTAGAWTVSSYAVCAYPPAGLETVTTTLASELGNKAASPTCGPGKKRLGLGWDVAGPQPGRVSLEAALPTETGAQVAAQEIAPVVTDPWPLTARAVCVTP